MTLSVQSTQRASTNAVKILALKAIHVRIMLSAEFHITDHCATVLKAGVVILKDYVTNVSIYKML